MQFFEMVAIDNTGCDGDFVYLQAIFVQEQHIISQVLIVEMAGDLVLLFTNPQILFGIIYL